MLGEFHNRNNSPGLRNKNFYPLRTPLPCLAIRHMVPTDIAFLDVDSYELNLRIAFLQSFLKVFGEEKHKEVETARNALNKILEKGNWGVSVYVCVCMFVRVNVGKCKVEKRYFQKMQKEKKRRDLNILKSITLWNYHMVLSYVFE